MNTMAKSGLFKRWQARKAQVDGLIAGNDLSPVMAGDWGYERQ